MAESNSSVSGMASFCPWDGYQFSGDQRFCARCNTPRSTNSQSSSSGETASSNTPPPAIPALLQGAVSEESRRRFAQETSRAFAPYRVQVPASGPSVFNPAAEVVGRGGGGTFYRNTRPRPAVPLASLSTRGRPHQNQEQGTNYSKKLRVLRQFRKDEAHQVNTSDVTWKYGLFTWNTRESQSLITNRISGILGSLGATPNNYPRDFHFVTLSRTQVFDINPESCTMNGDGMKAAYGAANVRDVIVQLQYIPGEPEQESPERPDTSVPPPGGTRSRTPPPWSPSRPPPFQRRCVDYSSSPHSSSSQAGATRAIDLSDFPASEFDESMTGTEMMVKFRATNISTEEHRINVNRDNILTAGFMLCKMLSVNPGNVFKTLSVDEPVIRQSKDGRAYSFLRRYIDQDLNDRKIMVTGTEKAVSRLLLQFWTGLSHVPATGLRKKLEVIFLIDQEDRKMFTSSTCTHELNIPTVHTEYSHFKQFLDSSISEGSQFFGIM